MKNWIAAILSAGQGKRMKTERPKVLHSLLDRPIVYYLIDLASKIADNNYYLIVSPKLYEVLHEEYKEKLIIQEKPLGTGDAVRQLIPVLNDFEGNILVLPGDVPLIREESLKKLCEIHEKNRNACTLITAFVEDPKGYGRIVRNNDGKILKIVEDKDASEEEKKIREINTSIYAFSWKKLKEVLPYLSNNNVQEEFYLPDTVSLLLEKGEKVEALTVDSWEVLGVNTQKELSYLQEIIQRKINEKWMEEGVSFISPQSVFIGKDVILSKDVIIYPDSLIFGESFIGKGATIGSNVFIENYYIGNHVKIGPFSFISYKKELKGE